MSEETYRASIEKLYENGGTHAPWTRVWRDGVDVTDRPELWPPLWSDPASVRRRGR